MIRKLQRSFMKTAMLSIGGVLLVVLLTINAMNWFQTSQQMNRVATLLAENQGQFPRGDVQASGVPQEREEGFRPDDALSTRYASVSIVNGKIQTVDTSHILELDESAVRTMVPTEEAKSETSGWHGQYRYAKATSGETMWLVYVDATRELANVYRLAMITIGTFIACLMVVAVLVWYFSKRAVQPFVDNVRRQQEFISNASHEIKTPLAVLSANNDLLAMSGQSNKWIDSNKRQIKRLNELIEQMLLLSRFDEGSATLYREKVVIGPIFQQIKDELRPLLEEKGIRLDISILQEKEFWVDEDSFRQLARILIENAIKYTTDDRVSVVLDSRQVRITNACEIMTKEQVSQLFERFYRVESSRNRSVGGSGMGLAIAKSIAKANHLQLRAQLLDDTHISFNLREE